MSHAWHNHIAQVTLLKAYRLCPIVPSTILKNTVANPICLFAQSIAVSGHFNSHKICYSAGDAVAIPSVDDDVPAPSIDEAVAEAGGSTSPGSSFII